jgi:hypothetical protein
MATVSRLEILFGIASAAVLTACGGGSVLRSGASGSSSPGGGSPVDPNSYFRIVRSQRSALRRTASIASPPPGGTSYFDTGTYTTTVTDGAGNAVMYGADGSTILSYGTAAVSGGGGAATISSTLNDGSTYSTVLPPGSAFASEGTTVVGPMTMNADAANGTCAATLVTDSGTVTVTAVTTADGLQMTLGDGTTGLVPNAVLAQTGLISASSKSRHALDLSSPGCWAAIALLIAALAAIVAAFWYLGPIVAYIATQITAAVQAGVAAGTISAGTAGINSILPAGAIFASLIAALSATIAGTIVAITNACVGNNAPRLGPQPAQPIAKAVPA